MYHLELRQFPHNMCRFNLTEEELRTLVVERWAREQWVELGERKWSPQQAKLTILEGPRIPMEELTMGRGWSSARRRGEDVTGRVLAAAKPQQNVNTQATPTDGSTDAGLLADSLALELLAQLEHDTAPLSLAWRVACARCPNGPASACLALAEEAVRSLLRSRLIVLVRVAAVAGDGGSRAGGAAVDVGEGAVDSVLRAIESWAEHGDPCAVRMRRA